ncbi:MAG: cytochrome P450 [Alphaproteobacteria bacterium]|nr:cytochrome P450 [Alphaproteobacteria bacterium]
MTSGFSPLSDESLRDPASAYARLHAQEPVPLLADHAPPFYTLTRHADVEAALRNIEAFSSEFGQGPRFTPPSGMLSDPPQHTFYRRLVQQAFTPAAVKALAGRIGALAGELLEGVANHDEFDVHDDYAFPLPVVIIAELLGVPRDAIQKFKLWSDASVEAMGAEDPAPWVPELERMGRYIQDQISLRREMETPPDDLITRLVLAESDGARLDDQEIGSVIRQLLVGGNETTTSLITNAVWRLLERRELWECVVADPSLVDRAIEESLRFDPPVLGLFRNTTREVTVSGVTIPEGTKVMMHYAAANRDPAVFDDPDTFSLDRQNRRHLAFGLGVHFCLGAELARLEARTALATIVARFPDLRLVDAGERIKPFFLWGRRRLPVRRGAR